MVVESLRAIEVVLEQISDQCEATEMTSYRKKPRVPLWATMVVVVALVVYPLSFRPVCRAMLTPNNLRFQLATFYKPLILVVRYPRWQWPRTAIKWYGGDAGELVYAIVTYNSR